MVVTAELNYQGGKGCYEISHSFHMFKFQFPCYKTEGCL